MRSATRDQPMGPASAVHRFARKRSRCTACGTPVRAAGIQPRRPGRSGTTAGAGIAQDPGFAPLDRGYGVGGGGHGYWRSRAFRKSRQKIGTGTSNTATSAGEITLRDKRDTLREIWRKVRRQTLKDYVAFPLLAGPFAPFVFAGNLTANLMRNVWAYTIIFCGHFPEGTQEFTMEETENESRGQWYFRQVLGSANLTGGKFFHVMSGNLSHQIEHHLFPDIPARRYAEIAPEVQEICERYGIPYNKGPLLKQFGTVVRKIIRLSVPDSWHRRPKESAPAELELVAA